MTDATKLYQRFKSQFTTTLRELCNQKGSVNQVCRDLGINRQQFSKYLSGTNLPSAFMLQRLIVYFSVEPSHFFLTKSTRSTENFLRSQKTNRLPDIASGFYLEHTLLPSQKSEYVEVGLWRLEKSNIGFLCSGELPANRTDRKRVFDSYDGEIGTFGKSYQLSAQCAARTTGVVYTLATVPFAPNDLFGVRLVSNEIEALPQCAPSLFRYIGSSIDIANVLGTQCGLIAEGELNARSSAALKTIKEKAQLTGPRATNERASRAGANSSR